MNHESKGIPDPDIPGLFWIRDGNPLRFWHDPEQSNTMNTELYSDLVKELARRIGNPREFAPKVDHENDAWWAARAVAMLVEAFVPQNRIKEIIDGMKSTAEHANEIAMLRGQLSEAQKTNAKLQEMNDNQARTLDNIAKAVGYRNTVELGSLERHIETAMRNLGIEELTKELHQLRRWKQEAIEVDGQCDWQQLARTLGIPPGVHVRANLIPAVDRLIAELHETRQKVEEMRKVVNAF